MTEWNEQIEEMIESLKQQRDELRVNMHLASMEAKEQWETIEKKWERWLAASKAQAKPLREVMEQSAKEVGSALDQVLEELKSSYARIKDEIKSAE